MSSARYTKMEKVGEGTYGVVYKAKEKETGNIVALKRMRLDSEDEGIPCSAIREVLLLKELTHPNIVRLLDVYHSQESKKLTLVFQFLKEDLKAYLDRNKGVIPPSEIQSFHKQLLLSIEFLHEKSVLHRDLKPQNLLIAEDKTLMLADFGLGRSFGIPVKRYTHEVVTLWYRAPDVLLGSINYGCGVDMWSTGCIFAELATGKPLFAGKNDADQLLRVYKFFGTPTAKEFPSAGAFPKSAATLSDKAFKTQFPSDAEAKFSAEPLKKLTPQGIAQLKELLKFEPSQRMTATNCLKHEFFKTALTP